MKIRLARKIDKYPGRYPWGKVREARRRLRRRKGWQGFRWQQ